MGKGYYIGGHTQINIYDEERILLKRIYRALYDEIKKYHITYDMIKKCFENYNLLEVVEASEFYLAEREKFLETLINFSKTYDKTTISEKTQQNNIIKYKLLKEDIIEGLKFDLKSLESKIEKNPTNDYLKKEKEIIIKKIEAISNSDKSKPVKAKKIKQKKENVKKKEKNIYNTESNIYLALKNCGLIK